MQQAVVPNRLLCDFLVSPKPVQLRTESDILHLGDAFFFVWLRVVVVALGPQIRHVVGSWVHDLLFLPPKDSRTLCIHLVKLLQQLVALLSLLLVELFDVVLDLVDAVELEPLRVDWIYQLVHPVEEHSDALFDLLVAHQVREVVV